LFAEVARVELIDGEIIDMPPMGSRHAGRSSRLADLLSAAVAGRALVRQDKPIRLGNDSEPQPDIAVVKARDDYYESGHPEATDESKLPCTLGTGSPSFGSSICPAGESISIALRRRGSTRRSRPRPTLG
jgi:hypothetical protein